MAKKERISINRFEKALENSKDIVTDIKWNELDIKIKKSLSLKEVITFVKQVVNSCFISDSDGSYHPEIKDFAIKGCIVDFYTNISLPSNAEKRYNLLYQSDIITTILDNINLVQYEEICESIDRKLNALEQSKIEMMDGQLAELRFALKDMQDKLSDLFSEINPEDISKIVGAIANNQFDESKIVEAYISQKEHFGNQDTPQEIVVEEA